MYLQLGAISLYSTESQNCKTRRIFIYFIKFESLNHGHQQVQTLKGMIMFSSSDVSHAAQCLTKGHTDI